MASPCWRCLPQLVRFVLSNDVTVRGLRIENSPQFHLKFDGCARVLVDGLFVSSPAFSPNTDGVHVENTTAVQILNSRIYNGTVNNEAVNKFVPNVASSCHRRTTSEL